ncbi:type III secretion system translocon subunit SctE [Vibrio harveyi]|nr:type III secretion system translocon subunit SctE [Vibrio harveyi]
MRQQARLMIAGGVMGAVSMVLQEPAVQDAMKEAGINVDALNKVVMALEIAVAVIGAIVTFGGAAAGGIAKLAAKSAGKIAQKVTDIATKAAANMAKIADMGSKAATTTAKAIRFGAETVDLAVNVGKGTTDAVHASKNAKVTNIQSDITDLRAKMTLSQAVIDKLKEEIAKLYGRLPRADECHHADDSGERRNDASGDEPSSDGLRSVYVR